MMTAGGSAVTRLLSSVVQVPAVKVRGLSRLALCLRNLRRLPNRSALPLHPSVNRATAVAGRLAAA